MITVSMCMIVKNEEKVLARCLDCVKDFMDEIVIVDTGSTDATRQIAQQYTDHVYDFTWVDDFSAARNFAFSKCTQEYIYSADADEVVDEENRERFMQLKAALLPEIEIVQMKYGNQLQYSTIYNYDEEYRPKLFKRVRHFVWEHPIHETVRLMPVVYDSDVVITHLPQENHTPRDIQTFERLIQNGKVLNSKLHNLYAKELFVSGTETDFLNALDFFRGTAEDTERSADEQMEAFCVSARGCRLSGDIPGFFKYAMKAVASEGCSEICYELGRYYMEAKDYAEASVWFYNAAYETESILNIHHGGDWAINALAQCKEKC